MNFRAFLTVTPLSGDTLSSNKKRAVELKSGPNLIGSSPDCDIVLPYPHIPSHLCIVTIDSSDRYLIQDLNQSLGIHTEENNERLQPSVDHVFPVDKSFYIGDHYQCVVEYTPINETRSPSESGLVLSGEEELYPEKPKTEMHEGGTQILSTLILPTLGHDEFSDFTYKIQTQLTDKDRLQVQEQEFKATQVILSEDEDFGKPFQVPAILTSGDEKNAEMSEDEKDSSQGMFLGAGKSFQVPSILTSGDEKNIEMIKEEKDFSEGLSLGTSPKAESDSREKIMEFLKRQPTTPYEDSENEEAPKNGSNQKSLERSGSKSKKAFPVHYTKEEYKDNDDDSFALKGSSQESPGKRKFVKNFRKSFEKKQSVPNTQEINTQIEIEKEKENEDKEEKKITGLEEDTVMDIEQEEEEKKDKIEPEESKVADQENQDNKKGRRATRGRAAAPKEQLVPVKRETRSTTNKRSTNNASTASNATSTKSKPPAQKKPKQKKATTKKAKSVEPKTRKNSRSSSRKSPSKSNKKSKSKSQSKSKSNTRGKKQNSQANKGASAKKQGGRSAGRKQTRSNSQNVKSSRQKSSPKVLSQPNKSSVTRRQSTDLVRQVNTQQTQTQSKKRKREESNSARTSIVKEFARQDDLKKSKKNDHKPSSKSTERVTIKKVQDSKKKSSAKDSDLFKRNLYQVTFSGINPTRKDVEDNKKRILELGIKIVEDPSKKFNVVVMDKFKRTLKFLIGLNEGAHIVDYKWIKDCIKEKKILDLTDYQYENASMETQYNFNLNDTLERARKAEKGLLEGYKVYVGKNAKPSQEEVRILVQSMGGEVLKKKPTEHRKDIIAILDEDDTDTRQEARQIGFKAYSSELAFSAVMHRKLDFKSFLLK